ncbi:MAG TPA: phosphoribosylglycinamide formyltransferase [Gaiellaceae bacterium]
MIGVLVSGSGTNLQALIDAQLPIACVGSNKPGVRGLERAAKAGIETGVFEQENYPERPARDTALADWLQERGVEWVVLAGYMHVLTPAFLSRFPRRVINLHPALLPSFPGAHAIDEALAYGVRWTGVTVHFVDEGVDTGPVILQEPVEVKDDDDVTTLAERIHAVEHRLLPEAARLCLDGRVRLEESSRRVRIT